LVAWFFGRLVPWLFGRLVPWFFGRLVPWFFGRLVPCFFGRLVPWFFGRLVPWLLGLLGRVGEFMLLWLISVWLVGLCLWFVVSLVLLFNLLFCVRVWSSLVRSGLF
jgi:hypothetical protein